MDTETPDVILVHGLWVPALVMSPLAARLAVAGFRCHLFRYEGRNQSLESNAERLRRMLRDRGPAHLVGHSLGGLVVLESLEHARRRDARIYAEVAGYGMTGDAHHMTAPDPEGDGAARAMAAALRDAALEPTTVGYINAHGTSTPYNDKFETMAIKRVFGDHARKLAVSSTKSMTGHLLGAAGGIEAIATAFALHHGVLPPTINYETPDPECDLDYVPNQARKQDVEVALSNAFGFGGTNATLAFKRYGA